MRKYRHFDEDFKRDVVARIDSGAITQAQAAREHNLSPSLIDPLAEADSRGNPALPSLGA